MRTNAQDLFDDDGRLKPIASLPRETASAVKAVKFDKQTGNVVEVVLADKISAANTLLKSIGVIRDEVTMTAVAHASASAELDVRDMSAPEFARRISMIIEDAAQAEGDVIDVSPAPAPIDQAQPRAPAASAPPRERVRAVAMSVVNLASEIRADHDALSFLHDMLSKAMNLIAQELAHAAG